MIKYLATYPAAGRGPYTTLEEAQTACLRNVDAGGHGYAGNRKHRQCIRCVWKLRCRVPLLRRLRGSRSLPEPQHAPQSECLWRRQEGWRDAMTGTLCLATGARQLATSSAAQQLCNLLRVLGWMCVGKLRLHLRLGLLQI